MFFKINGIKVSYDGAEIIKGISFEVVENEIVTLIGPNGAGKTTILRTISGLKRPQKGKIYFQNKNIENLDAADIVNLGISQVPQGRGLFPHMTVLDNLKVGAFSRKNKQEIQTGLDRVMRYFPILKDRSKQMAGTFSGGEQQMLAIGIALMTNPKFLLLDEPSIGLAPRIVGEVCKIIKNINKDGISVLLVEQNARLALKLATKGYVLETGKIVISGDSKFLIHSEHVSSAYLGD